MGTGATTVTSNPHTGGNNWSKKKKEMDDQFRFSVCIAKMPFEKKPTEEQRSAMYGGATFERKELSIDEFKWHVERGYMFHNATGQRKGTTKATMIEEGFSSQYIVLDIDGDKRTGTYPTLSNKVEVRTAFCKLKIKPTLEYDTFSASESGNVHKFRMVWVLKDPIDAEQYKELATRVDIVAETVLPFKADKTNTLITQPFNGTDKHVECNPENVYTYEEMTLAMNAISEKELRKFSNRKTKTGTRRDTNELTDSKALNELMDLGVYSFLRKYREEFPPVNNSKDCFCHDQGSDITILPEGYEVFETPVVVKNGKVDRKKLRDGDKRKLWVFNWSSTLSEWLRRDPNLLGGKGWKYRYLTTICQLIMENFAQLSDVDGEPIAEKIEEGYAYANDKGRKRSFKFNKEDVKNRYAMSNNQEYIDFVRKNCAKYACDVRRRNALSKYDFNKTIEENAEDIGITTQTLKNYLRMENMSWDTNTEKTTNEIVEYCKRNAEYGAAGVIKLMEAESDTLPFKVPKSRTTIYKIFKDNGIPTKGTDKQNKIVNRVIEDAERNSEKLEKTTRRANIAIDELKAQKGRIKDVKEENERLKKELESLRIAFEEKEIETEQLNEELRKQSEIIAYLKKKGEQNTTDIDTLNVMVVNHEERLGVVEGNYAYMMSQIFPQQPCVPRNEQIKNKTNKKNEQQHLYDSGED